MKPEYVADREFNQRGMESHLADNHEDQVWGVGTNDTNPFEVHVKIDHALADHTHRR